MATIPSARANQAVRLGWVVIQLRIEFILFFSPEYSSSPCPKLHRPAAGALRLSGARRVASLLFPFAHIRSRVRAPQTPGDCRQVRKPEQPRISTRALSARSPAG